jgi:hypothetical protein
MDFDAIQLRSDTHNGALLSRVATKVADELLFQYETKNLFVIIMRIFLLDFHV